MGGVQDVHRQWGQNIESRMTLFGFRTHQDLADALGVSQSTVTRWIAGLWGPSDRHKLQIARLLNCEVRVLFPLFVGSAA
jgi:transcriptional regulator with XRE-family HTH domain